MAWLSKAFGWCKLNIKWVIFAVLSALFIIFFLWLSNKNRKIRALENDLAIMKSKLQVEGLAQKYEVAVKELAALKQSESALQASLTTIETSLHDKLKDNMTADEIIAKFKTLGLQ